MTIAKRILHPPQSQPAPPVITEVDVEVLSEPPGARIEVDDGYIGDAPIVIRVRATDGRIAESFKLTALPRAGGWTQSKQFVRDKPVPKRIFFDTNLKPRADTEVEVHVD